jgi:hypothetical protein
MAVCMRAQIRECVCCFLVCLCVYVQFGMPVYPKIQLHLPKRHFNLIVCILLGYPRIHTQLYVRVQIHTHKVRFRNRRAHAYIHATNRLEHRHIQANKNIFSTTGPAQTYALAKRAYLSWRHSQRTSRAKCCQKVAQTWVKCEGGRDKADAVLCDLVRFVFAATVSFE